MTGLVTAAAPPLSAHDFVTIGPHALSPLAQSPHQFYNVKPRFITPERMAPPPADGEEAPFRYPVAPSYQSRYQLDKPGEPIKSFRSYPNSFVPTGAPDELAPISQPPEAGSMPPDHIAPSPDQDEPRSYSEYPYFSYIPKGTVDKPKKPINSFQSWPNWSASTEATHELPTPKMNLRDPRDQSLASSPQSGSISPNHSPAWPPLDALTDSGDSNSFWSYKKTPEGSIIAHYPEDFVGSPKPLYHIPTYHKGQYVGPGPLKDYVYPHDHMAPSPSPESTAPSPQSGSMSPDHSPAWPPLDALTDSEDSNSFWTYKKTPNGNIIAHYPEDFVGSPKPLYHIPTYHKGQAVGPGPLKDYVFPHDPMVPSESPENLAPSPQSGGNRKLLANTPDDLTASPQIFRRPGLSSVYAFPAHTPPLKNFFEGRPELEEVAEKQGKALVQGKREPISSDNLASWTKQNQDYLQLKPKDQEEIRTWLQQRYFDSDPTSETGGKAIAYIWSLQKSTGKHLVWWGNPIINAGNSAEHEFIDLVEIGDTLSFFNKRANFEILDQDAEAISKKLLKILEYDSQKNLRSHALAIPKLIDVKGRHGVSMYKARVGQLMNKRLRHFDQKDDRSKEKVLQDLYFFVGESRKDAISMATNALKKSPKLFKQLLTPERGVPGQADYERIEGALSSLGKGGFFQRLV
ncbi:hypothetical protein MJO29_006774 [Puccinia striiformis f. sp. tritici]|nr:hypothetical protein MJO29_006774 [Puccinia striiformis f. sp. tritici]